LLLSGKCSENIIFSEKIAGHLLKIGGILDIFVQKAFDAIVRRKIMDTIYRRITTNGIL
jgi:hypothetical protein